MRKTNSRSQWQGDEHSFSSSLLFAFSSWYHITLLSHIAHDLSFPFPSSFSADCMRKRNSKNPSGKETRICFLVFSVSFSVSVSFFFDMRWAMIVRCTSWHDAIITIHTRIADIQWQGDELSFFLPSFFLPFFFAIWDQIKPDSRLGFKIPSSVR